MADGAVDSLLLTGVERDKPFAHTDYGWLKVLGRRRDGFGGTDALSMSVQPAVIEWVWRRPADAILGEGDRLANGKFFAAVPDLTIIYLDTPVEVARRRMAERADRLGKPMQNEPWWKGRMTKVDNLIARWPHVRYDGTLPPAELAGMLASHLAK
jgi:hypothetical protein